MSIFLNKNDLKISKEFENKGYIIKNITNKLLLREIENIFFKFARKELKIKKKIKPQELLNNIQKYLPINKLNSFQEIFLF